MVLYDEFFEGLRFSLKGWIAVFYANYNSDWIGAMKGGRLIVGSLLSGDIRRINFYPWNPEIIWFLNMLGPGMLKFWVCEFLFPPFFWSFLKTSVVWLIP